MTSSANSTSGSTTDGEANEPGGTTGQAKKTRGGTAATPVTIRIETIAHTIDTLLRIGGDDTLDVDRRLELILGQLDIFGRITGDLIAATATAVKPKKQRTAETQNTTWVLRVLTEHPEGHKQHAIWELVVEAGHRMEESSIGGTLNYLKKQGKVHHDEANELWYPHKPNTGNGAPGVGSSAE